MKRIYTLNNALHEGESESLSNCHWRQPNAQGFRAEKQAYKTKSEAKRALKELGRFKGLSVYKCPVCGFYHLGHKRK